LVSAEKGVTQAAAGEQRRSVAEALSRDPGVMAEVARLAARNPRANPLSLMPDVDPRRVPRHVAVIMDGNGRWAQQRGFPRFLGHRAGAGAVRELVETAGTLGIEVLTLYSFSLENW
jgi:undecaprenyl pyrophosphate synthase